MTKATIYIARHGECVGNVAQKLLDPFEDVLTETGKAQAELLGKHLSDVPFTRAFCSNYPRTQETAENILKENTKVKGAIAVQSDERIRERCYVSKIGCNARDVLTELYAEMKNGAKFPEMELEGSETVAEFEGRIFSFYKELIKTLRESGQDETVLIVSHGLTIQRAIILLNTKPELMGVDTWENNTFCERLTRNTTYHKIVLELGDKVAGRVEKAHCRDHIEAKVAQDKPDGVKDEKNYSFIKDSTKSGFEKETMHYCQPV